MPHLIYIFRDNVNILYQTDVVSFMISFKWLDE